jgi:hypothetical protein
MDEIGFVIKSFIVSVFAVFCLQMKMGESSVESRIVGYMQDAKATKWMKDMGAGATRMTASTYNKVIGDVFKKGKNNKNSIDAQLKKVKEAADKHEQELLDIENQ